MNLDLSSSEDSGRNCSTAGTAGAHTWLASQLPYLRNSWKRKRIVSFSRVSDAPPAPPVSVIQSSLHDGTPSPVWVVQSRPYCPSSDCVLLTVCSPDLDADLETKISSFFSSVYRCIWHYSSCYCCPDAGARWQDGPVWWMSNIHLFTVMSLYHCDWTGFEYQHKCDRWPVAGWLMPTQDWLSRSRHTLYCRGSPTIVAPPGCRTERCE